jgi:hypothetical protein
MPGRKGHRGWGHIRRLPSSRRYQASYIGPDLGRHAGPTTYVSRLDAEHWLASERRLIDRDEWTPPLLRTAQLRAQSETLGEYATQWIEPHALFSPTQRMVDFSVDLL